MWHFPNLTWMQTLYLQVVLCIQTRWMGWLRRWMNFMTLRQFRHFMPHSWRGLSLLIKFVTSTVVSSWVPIQVAHRTSSRQRSAYKIGAILLSPIESRPTKNPSAPIWDKHKICLWSINTVCCCQYLSCHSCYNGWLHYYILLRSPTPIRLIVKVIQQHLKS